MKAGFIFIWIEKELIPKVICFCLNLFKKLFFLIIFWKVFDIMESWKFIYVENLVWIKKQGNNQLVEQPSAFFRRSKVSLYIFRKDSPNHIELRHQRNSDVTFQFLEYAGNLFFCFFPLFFIHFLY